MDDNGNELEGDGIMDEEQSESETEDPENEAILREKEESSSPRDNI